MFAACYRSVGGAHVTTKVVVDMSVLEEIACDYGCCMLKCSFGRGRQHAHVGPCAARAS